MSSKTGAGTDNLTKLDPEVVAAIKREQERQSAQLVLIASENYASPAVLRAQGSVLTNKYAEGYPGHRYYSGCQEVDDVESLAIERAKQLFGADHANVQPHSGSQANLAVYSTLLNPGDAVLAMSMLAGGHLSHGSHANISGHLYRFFHYSVNSKTERLDYDEVERLARKHKPKLIVVGASSYPRTIDFQAFMRIADLVGARLMTDMAHIAGLVAGDCHPSPVPYCDVVTGTSHKTLRGPRGGLILCRHELASDIDKAVFPGMQGGPLMHIIAAKAVAFREAAQPEFARYQAAVVENAKGLAEQLKEKGFRLVSGGTDNHLLLIDLREWGITGKVAQQALEAANISVNRNSIPFDPLPPWTTSGIRLGTAAVTTRGFSRTEVERISELIHKVLSNVGKENVTDKVRGEVREMLQNFPVPGVA